MHKSNNIEQFIKLKPEYLLLKSQEVISTFFQQISHDKHTRLICVNKTNEMVYSGDIIKITQTQTVDNTLDIQYSILFSNPFVSKTLNFTVSEIKFIDVSKSVNEKVLELFFSFLQNDNEYDVCMSIYDKYVENDDDF